MLFQPDYPGWLYAIDKGATTIWERWNSILPNGDFDESGMNSLNHYSYGAIGDWLYRKVAGINALEPGYHRILIKPYLTHGITEVNGILETMYGTVSCTWTCRNKKITVDVRIPANTTAQLILPEQEGELELGSGNYHFEYDTETSLQSGRYHKNMVFAEILDDPESSEILYQVMPEKKENPMIGFIRTKTIAELSSMSDESAKRLSILLQKLNQAELGA